MRSSARSLALRVLLTFAAPILLFAVAPYLPLPGVDGVAPGTVGVFSMGIMPIVSAYALVELVALAVPRLARLRLERAARVVAVVLAVVQAFGIARFIAVAPDPVAVVANIGLRSTLLIVASLVGGACVVFLLASLVTRQGLVNGVVLFALGGLVVEMHHGVAPALKKALRLGSLTPKDVGVCVCALAVAGAATWIALRGALARPRREAGSDPYRGGAQASAIRPIVAIPASSIAPFAVAGASVALATSAASLLSLPVGGLAPTGPSSSAALELALTLALGFALAHVIHRPREAADLVLRLGGADAERARTDARRALSRAMPATLLYLAVLVMAAHAFATTRIGRGSILVVPLLVALVMDFVRAVRDHARAPDLVPVWQERRAAAVPLVASVLAAEGIEVRAHGTGVLCLLSAFAPYAPAELLVRAEDGPRATAVLRHVFLGESAPAHDAPASPTPERDPPSATLASRTRRLLAMAAFAAGLVGLAMAKSPARGSGAGRAQLAVVRVDDDTDPFESIPAARVPSDVEIFAEAIPVATAATERRLYARTDLRPGETFDGAVARMTPWLATIAVPPGERFAFEPVSEYDDTTGTLRTTGVRSYLVAGEPILTTADVTAAEPMIDDDPRYGAYVAVTLTPEAGERFGEATRAWVHRRLAIVIDGTINSAPVVRSAIFGGRISITLGQGDPDKQIAEAKLLADRLAGR